MDLLEKENIINEYHANEMYKLKQICKPLIYKKGVPGMYHDDLYAVASDTLLESLEIMEYLEGLSPLQRKIICMVSESYTPEEICNDLHITMKHYKNSLQRISADEKIKPLKSLVGRERQCAY